MTTIRIATRESALALWQANHVRKLLEQAHPRVTMLLVPMTTRGDQIIDKPLAEIGGKALFLKELEVAMLEDRGRYCCALLKGCAGRTARGSGACSCFRTWQSI